MRNRTENFARDAVWATSSSVPDLTGETDKRRTLRRCNVREHERTCADMNFHIRKSIATRVFNTTLGARARLAA